MNMRNSFAALETLEGRRLLSAGVFATGGVGSEGVEDMALDAKGNIYVAGSFTGKTDFQPGGKAHIVKAKGDRAAYLARYDAGGKLAWVYTLGKKETNHNALAVALDKSGNAIVVIRTDAAGFDNDLTHILKLDKKGQPVWKKSFNLDSSTGLTDIAVDAKGGIYATGSIGGPVKFGDTTLQPASAFDTNGFVARFNKKGAPVWARMFEGGTYTPRSIAIDAKLNVIVAGNHMEDFDADPNPDESINVDSGYGGDATVIKLDKSGLYQWHQQIGSDGSDEAKALATDAGGNVYVTGKFGGNAALDGIALTNNSDSDDVFVAKINAAGQARWAHGFGGQTSDECGTQLFVNDKGVFLAGYFSGSDADLVPGGDDPKLDCVGWSNGFVMKLKLDGKHQFTRQIAQKQQVFTSGSNSIAGLACDGDGNIILAGTFEWETDFDPSKKKQIEESVNWDPDIFVLTLNSKGNL